MTTLYICSMAYIALVNGVDCPPPVENLPLLILNYYPLDDNGNWVSWNYQADDTPQYVGTGYKLELEYDGFVAACITGWSTREYSTLLSFWYRGEYRQVLCLDSFGAKGYSQPFRHPNFNQWVIAVDIFSAVPIYEIITDWSIEVVNVDRYLAGLK